MMKPMEKKLLKPNYLPGRGIKDGLVLTDDFSPIESMMIELMDEYFPKYISLYNKILS